MPKVLVGNFKGSDQRDSVVRQQNGYRIYYGNVSALEKLPVSPHVFRNP